MEATFEEVDVDRVEVSLLDFVDDGQEVGQGADRLERRDIRRPEDAPRDGEYEGGFDRIERHLAVEELRCNAVIVPARAVRGVRQQGVARL